MKKRYEVRFAEESATSDLRAAVRWSSKDVLLDWPSAPEQASNRARNTGIIDLIDQKVGEGS